MCNILNELFMSIYNEDFDFQDLEKRIQLQKAVYLLENMGISVGDYSFSLNKYGPYSLSLDSDAINNTAKKDIAFSGNATRGIQIIQQYLSIKSSYSRTRWMECIATIHYLHNVFKLEGQSLLGRLKELKSYLQDDMSNNMAWKIVKEMPLID